MPRLTYHLSLGNNLDIYTSASIGYLQTKVNFETNDTSYVFDDSKINLENKFLGFDLPDSFTGRIVAGARFYLTPELAGNAEIGFFGGALVNIGISYRFKSKGPWLPPIH
jgi:hypothetical protein